MFTDSGTHSAHHPSLVRRPHHPYATAYPRWATCTPGDWLGRIGSAGLGHNCWFTAGGWGSLFGGVLIGEYSSAPPKALWKHHVQLHFWIRLPCSHCPYQSPGPLNHLHPPTSHPIFGRGPYSPIAYSVDSGPLFSKKCAHFDSAVCFKKAVICIQCFRYFGSSLFAMNSLLSFIGYSFGNTLYLSDYLTLLSVYLL